MALKTEEWEMSLVDVLSVTPWTSEHLFGLCGTAYTDLSRVDGLLQPLRHFWALYLMERRFGP